MSEPSVYVCRVQTPEGEKDYVTLLRPEHAFSRGLAPEAIIGVLTRPLASGEPITPENFARNRVFVEFLHRVIAHRGPSLPDLITQARRQGDGWVVVIDLRTAAPEGPIPPEDIFGAFEVRSGSVVPGSYRASPRHKILTAHGFFQLPADLQTALAEELASLGGTAEGLV
jgi:hypothetical protein